MERAREATRELLGFLFSTPAYWPTLELYGRAEIGPRLRDLTREGRWGEMKSHVDDDLIDELSPSGTYDEIAAVLRSRFRGLATAVTFPVPEDPAEEPAVARVIEELQR